MKPFESTRTPAKRNRAFGGVMKFAARRRVRLQAENGAELSAFPFFYSDAKGAGLAVELYTEHGMRLHVVDAEQGVYSLGEHGTIFIVQSYANQERGLST